MELIALLSSGKESWQQVTGLLNQGDWENIILIGSDEAKQFTHSKEFQLIQVNLSQRLKDLKEEFGRKLKGKIAGTEVALSIASGDGKEHMALISALLSVPVGVRFTALTKDGVVFL